MLDESLIRSQLNNTVSEISLPQLGHHYRGKVRENFIDKENHQRIIISTDRLSAFDRVITTIPFKGQLLNQMSVFWFEKTKHIAPNHIIDVPDPNVVRVHECESLPIEMIVRAYITGSAWRAYQKGESVSGIIFPPGLKNYQKLPEQTIKLYEYLIMNKSWWDTVDMIASKFIGNMFLRFPDLREEYLTKWLNSENIWLRRVCILYQLKYKENTDTKILERVISKTSNTNEFFLNKAIGWILREYSKTNAEYVKNFVKNYNLSNLSKREALKWLNKRERTKK